MLPAFERARAWVGMTCLRACILFLRLFGAPLRILSRICQCSTQSLRSIELQDALTPESQQIALAVSTLMRNIWKQLCLYVIAQHFFVLCMLTHSAQWASLRGVLIDTTLKGALLSPASAVGSSIDEEQAVRKHTKVMHGGKKQYEGKVVMPKERGPPAVPFVAKEPPLHPPRSIETTKGKTCPPVKTPPQARRQIPEVKSAQHAQNAISLQ